MDYRTLNNGIKIPALGFGTYKIDNDEAACAAVSSALKIGYRHIDTAVFYHNEVGVGEGIATSGVAREDIFLVTKLWTSATSFQKATESIENSLSKLKTDYLDMLLIHWPIAENAEVWRAMEAAHKAGKVRVLGVSNFKEHHLQDILDICTIRPSVNQVELHPIFQQPELRAFCASNGIIVEAWSPLCRGKAFEVPIIAELAAKYGRSTAQIILRWNLQSGLVTIPKTTNEARMRENLAVFDFELTAEDMARIAAADTGVRQFRDPDCHGF